MPINHKGGKKTKSQKRDSCTITKQRDIPISEKSDDSHIGLLQKNLGDGRWYANIVDMNGKQEKTYMCNLSSGTKKKYCKGIILAPNRYVLIAIREFQKDKADIIFAYKDSELNYLIEKKQISSIITSDTSDSSNNDIVFTEFPDALPDNELDVSLI